MTVEQISGPNATNVNGIGAWTEQGIVGRGVLLDWYAWMQEQGKPAHNAFEAGDIPLSDLKKVAEWEGVEFKFGDILIIRSGECNPANVARYTPLGASDLPFFEHG